MAGFKFGRGRGGAPAPSSPPAGEGGRRRGPRTPMGIADQRASNNLLIGLGVGLITTVTGLSAAGTITAINAMHRQSEEAIAEEERHQQELDRQQAALDAAQQGGQSGTGVGKPGGSDVTYPEDPGGKPSDTPGTTVPEGMMTKEQFMAQLPEQVQWMIEKHITYDEYGLPRDEYGSLMNDPTTEIYDPARWSYFFSENNEEKEPRREDLPTQGEIDESNPPEGGESGDGNERPQTPVSERPVKAPDKPSGYEQGITDPDSIPIENPAVERPSGGDGSGEGGGDGTGTQPGDEGHGGQGVVNPDVTRPDPAGSDWWKGEDGKPIQGISVDEQGKPFYVVAPGDSLGSIGSKYGFAVSDIVTASKITNPNVLYVGDIIRFPEAGPSMPGTLTPNVTRPGGTGSGGTGTGTEPGTGMPSGNEGNTDGVTTGSSTGGSATGLG